MNHTFLENKKKDAPGNGIPCRNMYHHGINKTGYNFRSGRG
jgi:hypothetical protein